MTQEEQNFTALLQAKAVSYLLKEMNISQFDANKRTEKAAIWQDIQAYIKAAPDTMSKEEIGSYLISAVDADPVQQEIQRFIGSPERRASYTDYLAEVMETKYLASMSPMHIERHAQNSLKR